MFHPTQLFETKKHGQNWLSRPEFLYDSNKMWSTQTNKTLDESNPKIRKAETFVAINVVNENIFIHIQYGSRPKIIRVMGLMRRICFNLKGRKLRWEIWHGALERPGMEPWQWRSYWKQKDVVQGEIQKRELGNKEVVSEKSKPQQQSPYLNEERLIWIGGHIKNAAKPGMAKHQIILPRKHVISADNQVLLQ